jgi:hypothetical protein
MAIHHPLDFLRVSSELLVALDWRPFHFALQPYHHLVRLLHVLSMSGFFGGIALLDLRLVGWHRALPLRALARQVLPPIYGLGALAVATGAALFFYAPVKVGSHPYFSLKLILILLGSANAVLFHRNGYAAALSATGAMPRGARMAGALSLALWTGVVVCACLNVEAAPKLLLH